MSEVLNTGGQYSAFADAAIFDAVRTPWVDLGGALAEVSPIDLGIKVGREVLARAQVDPLAVDSVPEMLSAEPTNCTVGCCAMTT